MLLAPTVSRLLAACEPGALATALTDRDAGHPAAPGHERAGHDHAGMPGHPAAPAAGDACGYCTLMSHNPVLASGIAFIFLPPPQAPWALTPGAPSAPSPALPEHRSRGPPLA